jgi:hypothetical protein
MPLEVTPTSSYFQFPKFSNNKMADLRTYEAVATLVPLMYGPNIIPHDNKASTGAQM